MAQYLSGGTEMTNRTADTSQRTAAIVAGIGLLITLIGVAFVELTTNSLIVPGDAETTARNIMASEALFRAGILGWVLAILGDMVRAWGLYVFFKHVNRSLALFSVWFMLVHDAIFAASLVNLFFGSVFPGGADLLTVFEPDQLQALGMLVLDGFDYGFHMGLFFFSFHLGIVGYLAYKSGYVPKILGVLLILGSFGYLTNSFTSFLFPRYEAIVSQFLPPFQIMELVFFLWLLIKGVNVEQWEKRALESA
jgi:hypothetical protein